MTKVATVPVALALLVGACSHQPSTSGSSSAPATVNATANGQGATTAVGLSGGIPSDKWIITKPAKYHEIEGYASTTSALPGTSVDFFVNSKTPTYSAEIYRMGWYGSLGAELLASRQNLSGVRQVAPDPDPATGLLDLRWSKSFGVTIPSTWASGVYLVKLETSSGLGAYIPFVVRDNRPSDLLFVRAVATDEAYNGWGGKSLYENGSYGSGVTALTHAGEPNSIRGVKVSFNRPFTEGFGAGNFLRWEYQLVRFMERSGLSASYVTDVDIHEHPELLLGHRAVIVAGHDEYWSSSMRDAYNNAVAHGVSLAVFGADTAYWQVRFEASANMPWPAGAARVLVCYKNIFADPVSTTDPRQTTFEFRYPPINRPESSLLGSAYTSDNFKPYPLTIRDASHWMFAGTGIRNGDQVAGIVGYEVDHYQPGGATPPSITVLAETDVTLSNGQLTTADTTIYTAPSGASVFNAGTIQWSWALDGFAMPGDPRAPTPTNVALQRATLNLLNILRTGSRAPSR